MTMVRTHSLVTLVGLPADFCFLIKGPSDCTLWDQWWESLVTKLKLDTRIKQLRFFILSSIMCSSKINTSVPVALMLHPVNNCIAVSLEIFLIEIFWLCKYPKQD